MGEFLQSDHSLKNDESGNSLISRRDIYILFVGGIVSASIGLILVRPIGSGLDFAQLLYSVNTVSMVFATGLFSFLTAGLLFSSRASRFYLLNKINEAGTKRAFLLRVLHTLAFTCIFSIFFTIIVFLYPFIPLTLNYYPISLNHFVFFPAVLGAALVGSVLLALIASSLATFIDDSRLCVVLGCASTLLISFLAGWNTTLNPWQYSLTRNLAFLSPHNIVRALAIQLSGYQFESAENMVKYVGFTFSAEGIIIALLLLGSISIVLLILGQRSLIKNSRRWEPLGSMNLDCEIWPESVSPEKSQKIARIRRGLRIQRGLTTMVIAGLLVSMMIGSSVYGTYLANAPRSILYVSPDEGERVSVGFWNIFEVDVCSPYHGLFNYLTFTFNMVTWGNASDTLRFYLGILKMDSTEFNALNEASRLEMVYNICNATKPALPGVGTGISLEDSYGSCVGVLLITADANPLENSYIEVSLLIVQNVF